MQTHSAMLLAMLALATTQAHARTWRESAAETLRAALRAEHAGVTSWDIEPLLSSKQARALERTEPADVRVTRMGKRASVRVTPLDGRARDATTVWFAVTALQNVITTATSLRQGQHLTAGAVMRDLADVFATTCTPLVTLEAITGMRAKVSLAAGEVLCREQIEPAPLVARGQTVTVRSTVGSVTILANGIAQQDGMLGKVLPIRNSHGATFLAAVTGRAEVEVR